MIIGGAFTAIVKSLVDNLINPLIGIFVQDGALAKLSFKLGNATFAYGSFLNDVLNFLITAFIVFILVKSINRIFVSAKKKMKMKKSLKQIQLMNKTKHY